MKNTDSFKFYTDGITFIIYCKNTPENNLMIKVYDNGDSAKYYNTRSKNLIDALEFISDYAEITIEYIINHIESYELKI